MPGASTMSDDSLSPFIFDPSGYMVKAAEKARAYREVMEKLAMDPFFGSADPAALRQAIAADNKPQPCICVHGRSRYCPRHVD